MSRVLLARVPGAMTDLERVEAVLRHRALYELAAVLPERQPVGRPADQPAWAVLLFGVLTRVYRSGQRAQAELAVPAMWDLVGRVVREVAADPTVPVPRTRSGAVWVPHRGPRWDHWRHLRDAYLCHPDVRAAVSRTFTEQAVAQARASGLLNPRGPGSFSHPDPTRAVYGDGTVIRSMYRPRPASGEPTPDTADGAASADCVDARRQDSDAETHHRHDGPVHGSAFVLWSVRSDRPYGRVVLAVDHVDAPGAEADVALRSLRQLHLVAGTGIQAVVYDGAFRGVHVETVMRELGVLVVNKVASAGIPGGADRTRRRRKGPPDPSSGPAGVGAGTRWHALGVWEHEARGKLCRHTLAAVDGAVCEVTLAEDGTPLVHARLLRRQVKRPRRSSGTFHFSAAFEVPCPHEPFHAWISPHAEPEDSTFGRPDAVRLIAPGEDLFERLYGLRNDAENANSELKRTLLVDRAMSLGWPRQWIDVLAWAVLSNAISDRHAGTGKLHRRARTA